MIGSGAGGAPIATELALAGASVVVLEAGGPAPLAPLGERIERSFWRVVSRRNAALSVARGLPVFPVIHGVCEGGSTALNAGSAFRLPEFLHREWMERGAPDLTDAFNRVDSFIKVSETADELLGRNGELMLKGLKATGWRGGRTPRNAPGCTGRAVCVLGCPEKAKQATHLSYLPVARSRGARVLLNTVARKITLNGRRATGVEARGPGGESVTIRAGTTIAAGGAVFTPSLLARSGIEAPQLGENFLLHPGSVLAVHFDEPVEMGQPAVPQSTYSDQFLESEGHMILLGSVPPHLTIPALAVTGSPAAIMDHSRTGFWGALIRDEGGRGAVRTGRDGRRRISYKIGGTELARLRQSLVRLAEMAFAAGAQAVTPLYFGSGRRYRSLKAFNAGLPDPLPLRRLAGGSVHPMGTCGIGRTCEGDGRVRGYENLHVSDASLFPTSIGVNPQFTIMALSTAIAAELLS
ncbi:MAG: GMC family oxidoreductase [Deltaproteobacteria bacterium]|nr:GMC family oxidoreductase [Deltaproteobacteria bacterium]